MVSQWYPNGSQHFHQWRTAETAEDYESPRWTLSGVSVTKVVSSHLTNPLGTPTTHFGR
jgi:hypothetical protein